AAPGLGGRRSCVAAGDPARRPAILALAARRRAGGRRRLRRPVVAGRHHLGAFGRELRKRVGPDDTRRRRGGHGRRSRRAGGRRAFGTFGAWGARIALGRPDSRHAWRCQRLRRFRRPGHPPARAAERRFLDPVRAVLTPTFRNRMGPSSVISRPVDESVRTSAHASVRASARPSVRTSVHSSVPSSTRAFIRSLVASCKRLARRSVVAAAAALLLVAGGWLLEALTPLATGPLAAPAVHAQGSLLVSNHVLTT